MRDLKGCSMNLRNQVHREGNGFLIREFPVQPLNDEGKYVMDYDMPELVVFIYEDHQQQFVKDICIDRVDSTKSTMEIVSSNSNGSLEFAKTQHPCIKGVTKMDGFKNLIVEGEVELGVRDENSIDHPIKKRTSEAQGEITKDEDYSRSFSLKHWQINSFLGRIGSRVESKHCAELLSRPHTGNSQTLTTCSTKSLDPQTDQPEEAASSTVGPLCSPTSDTTKSESSSDQSNGSKSSTNSFSFPILTPDWKGSPVRMAEADRRKSRNHQRRKTCFPCF